MKPGCALAGRVAERRALGELLDALDAGGGGAAVLRGEAGIGKTALLTDLADRAGARGHRVARGRATELERGVPFALFADALPDAPASDGGMRGAIDALAPLVLA